MNLRGEFERCWPWLAAAIEHGGGTHSKEDLWGIIGAGNAHLVPLAHGALVTTMQQYPTGLRDVHGWLAGGNLEEIVKAEPRVADYYKSQGCHRVTITGRDGWLRKMPGYKKTGVILVKDLR